MPWCPRADAAKVAVERQKNARAAACRASEREASPAPPARQTPVAAPPCSFLAPAEPSFSCQRNDAESLPGGRSRPGVSIVMRSWQRRRRTPRWVLDLCWKTRTGGLCQSQDEALTEAFTGSHCAARAACCHGDTACHRAVLHQGAGTRTTPTAVVDWNPSHPASQGRLLLRTCSTRCSSAPRMSLRRCA